MFLRGKQLDETIVKVNPVMPSLSIEEEEIEQVNDINFSWVFMDNDFLGGHMQHSRKNLKGLIFHTRLKDWQHKEP